MPLCELYFEKPIVVIFIVDLNIVGHGIVYCVFLLYFTDKERYQINGCKNVETYRI